MFLKKLCLNQSERNGIRIKVKFMKDFFKAYKLYFKASFSPILVGLGMFFLAFIGLALIFAGAKLTDDDYMSMIGMIGMVNVYQVL